MNNKCIKVIPLGGLGEIGKNMTAFEYYDEIIVIDCGLAFPEEEMLGVDLVIPEITYLEENSSKISGIFLTHGHEDHIGALPYVLKKLNMPVYGTRLTLGILAIKLKEHNMLNDCVLNSVEAGTIVKLKKFAVEFIRNTHSIADSCCLALHTDEGIIFHTGDFKLDYTPADKLKMDLNRISELGESGVLLLMSDSTNIERPGYSISEKAVGEKLQELFAVARGRVIVATFASNVHRMQHIINASNIFGRKIAFSGRSMENISRAAIELGYLKNTEKSLINVDELKNYPDEKITIITTGSQGEPLSALSRIAFSTHRKIKVEPGDTYIISASPIPGNGKLVARVINELFRKGAKVIYEALEEVHASGHGYKEELKLIHTLIHPKYFMPVHGEYRHLIQHRDLAIELGLDKDNIFILENGDILNLTKTSAVKSGRVSSGAILVDGLGVGDVGNIVLRDRKQLAEDGMLTIVAAVEKESSSLIAGPDIITRGFIYVKESEYLINEVKDIARDVLQNCLDNKVVEWYVLKASIKKEVEAYIYTKTKRRPNVLPVILEI